MPARILVVEDNPANLELITYLLRAFGHAPSAAISGEEALSSACYDPPDLIICDVHLPGMDGCEVAHRLKAHPVTCDIPLVAVTALAMVGDRERILQAGFDAYIPKPIDPETFVPQVETSLRDPRPRRLDRAAGPKPLPVQILMIDDSPVDILLARGILEPLGHRVVTAGDVFEGLELARRSPPDLILSDVQVGCGRGADLLAELHKEPSLQETPVVFISSMDGRHTAASAGVPQAAGHLVRPLASRALLGIVESCLQERKHSDGDDPGHR